MRLKSALLFCAVASLSASASLQASTEYVETPRWSFSYTNDGLEGIVLRNVWYTSAPGQKAQIADWLALEFFRVKYQDDAAGPYSDNFQLNSKALYIECPTDWNSVPWNLCSLPAQGCSQDPSAPGCTDSSSWIPPRGGVSVCRQGNTSGEVRLTAQGGFNCGQYRFVETFSFLADGTIQLNLAAKGVQATNGEDAGREHMHYAYFRLDVDSDGGLNRASVDGAAYSSELALELGGNLSSNSQGQPLVFSFQNDKTGKTVWTWAPQSDPRASEARHGEASWIGWSQYDAWLQRYHEEELVGRRSASVQAPPYGQCGGDEEVEYEDTGSLLINREEMLSSLSSSSLVYRNNKPTQVPGAESLEQQDAVLWLNAAMYHDADPAGDEHGCHDVEVRLKPSWGGCYPLVGESCSTGKTYQCDGSCQ